jgi:hypothetical protein
VGIRPLTLIISSSLAGIVLLSSITFHLIREDMSLTPIVFVSGEFSEEELVKIRGMAVIPLTKVYVVGGNKSLIRASDAVLYKTDSMKSIREAQDDIYWGGYYKKSLLEDMHSLENWVNERRSKQR